MIRSTPLEHRARSLGVASSYEDAGGVRRRVPEETVTRVCDLLEHSGPVPNPSDGPFDDVIVLRGGRLVSGVRPGTAEPVQLELILEGGERHPAEQNEFFPGAQLPELPHGIHRLSWSTSPGQDHDATVIVAPQSFPPLADNSSHGGARTAVFTPAYAPWSTPAGMPTFDSLVAVADVVEGHGIDCIATLPLFAPGLGSRFHPSPYSPVSRFHLNEVYAAGGLPDVRSIRGGSADGARTTDRGGFVDWDVVSSDALERIGAFAQALGTAEESSLQTFLQERPDVVSYAAFCATDGVPQRLYEVGQWLAERSLDAVVAELHARGVRLALDLPVGARPDGWEHATWPELFVDGVTIGAPADSFFEEGQDWGLPPIDPVASRRSGHRMWHDLLANAARHADILRIDHVMQVLRLWWVPVGSGARQGTYVSYPAHELLAVAALVAERTGTTMVGEDLGTVPPEMVELMGDWRLPGMHEEVFALYDMAKGSDDRAKGSDVESLPEVSSGSWAGLRTHDMAPVAAVASEVDTRPYRRALATALDHEVSDGVGPLVEAMIERLCRSNAGEVVVDLHDTLGVAVPHNVPGTVSPRNWSHRLPIPVEELADEPRLQSALEDLGAMATERRLPPAQRTGQR